MTYLLPSGRALSRKMYCVGGTTHLATGGRNNEVGKTSFFDACFGVQGAPCRTLLMRSVESEILLLLTKVTKPLLWIDGF